MASLVRAKRRGSGLFRTLFFLPVVVGFAAAGYLWLWFVNPRVGPLPQILRDLGFGSLAGPLAGHHHRCAARGLPHGALEVQRLHHAAVHDGHADHPRRHRGSRPRRWRRPVAACCAASRCRCCDARSPSVVILTTAGSLLAFDQFFVMTRGGPNNSHDHRGLRDLPPVLQQLPTRIRRRAVRHAGSVLLVISAIQLRLLRSDDDSAPRSRSRGTTTASSGPASPREQAAAGQSPGGSSAPAWRSCSSPRCYQPVSSLKTPAAAQAENPSSAPGTVLDGELPAHCRASVSASAATSPTASSSHSARSSAR